MVDEEFKPSTLKEYAGVALVRLVTKRFILAACLLLATVYFGINISYQTAPNDFAVGVFGFLSGTTSTVLMFYFGDTNKLQVSSLLPTAYSQRFVEGKEEGPETDKEK
jgi:hypothetical protein